MGTVLNGDAQQLWETRYHQAMASLASDKYSPDARERLAQGVAWRLTREQYEIGDDGAISRKERLGLDEAEIRPAGIVNLTTPFAPGANVFEDDDASPPIQAARTGTWYDMWGREVVLTEGVFDAIIQNFESGVRGQDLPVLFGHANAEAAGWIETVWRQSDVLMMQLRWNSLGKTAVADEQYRYVSIGVDLENRALWEVSLTNLPAVKGLEALRLSEPPSGTSMFYLGSRTFAETLVPPREPEPGAEPAQEPEPDGDDDLICSSAEGVVVAMDPNTFDLESYPVPEGGLTDEQKAQLAERLGIVVKPAVTPVAKDAADPAPPANLGEQLAVVGVDFDAIVAQLREEGQRSLAEQLRAFREEQRVTTFSVAMCNEGSMVLPGTADEMKAMLMSVPQAAREPLMEYLKSVKAVGLVDLSERGTEVEGAPAKKRRLSEDGRIALRSHLSSGGDVATFFEANKADFGAVELYDLSEFGK